MLKRKGGKMSKFNKKEKDFIKSLSRAGLPEKEAMSLAAIIKEGETKSKRIEKLGDIRQPEVSISVQALREKGWVGMESEKREGKGRPFHIYYLEKDLDDIIKEIEAWEKEKIKEIEKNIDKMKELAEVV